MRVMAGPLFRLYMYDLHQLVYLLSCLVIVLMQNTSRCWFLDTVYGDMRGTPAYGPAHREFRKRTANTFMFTQLCSNIWHRLHPAGQTHGLRCNMLKPDEVVPYPQTAHHLPQPAGQRVAET